MSPGKNITCARAAFGLLLLLTLLPAHAILPRRKPQLEDFDKRARAAEAQVPADKQEGLRHLKELAPNSKVDWDPVLGTPHWIRAQAGFLTEKAGSGKGISKAVEDQIPINDPDRTLKGFLNEHKRLFGHDASALAGTRKTREFVAEHNGLRTVVFQQEFEKIRVYEALLVAHTTKDGELVSVSSHFLSDLATAARKGMPQRNAAKSISPESAVAFAARAAGEEFSADQVQTGKTPAQGNEKHFSAPGLKGDTTASLVWLPLDGLSMRLCWEVYVTSRKEGETFRVLIDFETGRPWLRQCLTQYASPASYRVYTSDSPSPFSPGHPTPSSVQPPLVARSLVTTTALVPNASPNGWINDGENETRGNNVDAHLDRDHDDLPDLPRPQGNPARVFDFPLDPAQSPTASGNAAVVQLFYWCNWMHDKLYELGFTEAAGNFQMTNFARGGVGGDPVLADAQDTSGFNNANMTTWPEGTSPRLQIYLFTGGNPYRDGCLDAEITLHEYTHGLTTRRVGGGVEFSAQQSKGLAEGWSDFFALSLLSEPGDNVDGNYPIGGYVAYTNSPVSENYYYGFRRYPYSTDMSKAPLTFKDIDPSQATGHPGIPINPEVAFVNASQMHAQGEVWCSALWEARANLIRKLGHTSGNKLILQIVTDALNLTPANPNFLQARDAIIQADFVGHAGTNQQELWNGFARRGLGASAASPSSATTLGVQEAFDLPDDLNVRPLAGALYSGPNGGPFSPDAITFTLSNTGTNPVSWRVLNTNSWLGLSNSSGTLPVGSGPYSLQSFVNSTGTSLPDGVYFGALLFSNITSHQIQTRQVTLSVGQPDYFTELFDHSNNDVRYQTLTFIPNGSGSYYAACREPATAFPIDPREGKTVSLNDDNYSQINLAGANNVSLYGKATNVFFIGSNGYITFDSGDSAFSGTLTLHFGLRRISGLFTDLNPAAGGRVSWQQLGDRAVVTFENVLDLVSLGPNSFQIEMFYDGRIRLTHLNISAPNALVGLSSGHGVLPAFLASDLTSYPSCSLPLVLNLPSSTVEAAGLLAGAGLVLLPGPTSTNLLVSLRSSDSSEVTVPASVLVPAGQSQAAFDIQVTDDSLLDGSQTAFITATAPGYFTGTASIAVNDNESATLTLAVPPQIREDAGLFTGTLTVSAPVAANVEVSLLSSDPSRLKVPDKVVLPAGGSSALFAGTILNNGKIEGNKSVLITAAVPNWTGATGMVTVLDDETNTLSLAIPSQVSEASGSFHCSVVLAGAVLTNQTVSLQCSAVSQFQIPSSVLIPAGQSQASFLATVIDNSVVEGNRTVQVMASAPGWFGTSLILQILDDDTPPQAFRPSPPNLASNTPVSVILSWNGGDGELIQNGDFESGTMEGWHLDNSGTGGFMLNDGSVDPESPDGPQSPFAGNFSALSNPSGAGRHTLYQDITVPASAASVSLQWAHMIRNHATAFGSNQQFRVEIRDWSNSVLAVAYASRPGDPLLGGWSSQNYDLSAFRGASIRIAFVEVDSTSFFNAHIDNVSVVANIATPFSYEVYLGTGPEPGSGELIGTTSDTFWPLPQLAPLTTYYWQVISRSVGENSSPVWSFTTRGVDHFAWNSFSATQRLEQPFFVTFTALDAAGSVITNFNGTASLQAWSVDEQGLALAPINMDPTVAADFSNGAWTGFVTVHQPAARMVLRAVDAEGHSGISRVLSVFQPNDLMISIAAASSPVIAGTELLYRIGLFNTGPATATGVHVTHTLPDGVGFNSVESTQGACILNGGAVECGIGTLQANSGAIISVYLNASVEGTLSTSATVTRQEADADPSNNSATLLTEVIPLRLLSAVGPTVNEDASVATFEIALDDILDVPVSFSFATADGSARAGSDYIRTNGAAVISPGDTHTFVSVALVDDLLNEPPETFALTIFSITNAFAGDSTGVASILDNDPEPGLLPLDGLTRVALSGQTNLDFKFNLSRPSGYPVSVDFSTADGTAYSGSDYVSTNGTLTIPAGATNATLRIAILSTFPDPTNRIFNLQLSNPSHAGLLRTAALGTIVGRNSRPTINVSDVSVNEGASGTVNAAFKVTLSFASTTNVTVEYATQPGTAASVLDFIPSSGLLTFAPGEALKTILVPVKGDLLDEPDETFGLLLSHWTNGMPGITTATGTILNDDPHPALRIQDAAVFAGPAADVEALVAVQLSAPSGRFISVDFHTRNGSALSGIDYVNTNGTITIPPGATNALIKIKVLRDQAEADEIFFLDLDNPSNVLLDVSSASISITHSGNGDGVVDHFEWSLIPSLQFSNYPIAVLVSARDMNGQSVPSFNSPVSFGAQIIQPPVEAVHGAAPSVTPLGSFYQDARSQVLYLASELGGPLEVSALSLDVITPPGQTLSNWTIRMKHTTESTSSAWHTNGWQIVFQGDVTLSSGGWVTFPFANSFAYNGSNNLIIDFSFDNSSASFDGLCRAADSLQPRCLFFRSDSNNGNPLLWSGTSPQGLNSRLVPNLRLLPAPVSLPVSPASASQWTNGTWSGSIAVSAVGTNVQLVAEDDDGSLGWSNPFMLKLPGDVAVTMNASPVPADVNSILTWSILVRNYGPIERTGLVLSNVLDAATAFVSASSTQGTCTWNGRAVRCDLGTLPAGATATLTVRALTPASPTTVSGSASVSQNEADPDLSNNSASSLVPVTNKPAQVALTSPVSGAQLNAGYQILLSASASDSLGINRVEFYDGPGLLGLRSQEPYLLPWNNPAVGPHTLRAVAYDNSGQPSTSAPVSIVIRGANPMVYAAPPGNWAYLYGGDSAIGGVKGAAVLDGTWDHNNASSAWDGLGRGPGNGSLGGLSTDGNLLTLEDAVSSSAGTANNQSFYFTRALGDPAVTNGNRILDDGVTITFRARLTPASITPTAEMPLPNGFGIFNGGKGNFGLRQAGQPGVAAPGLISFSLVQNVEDSSISNRTVFPASGLVMNRLNGDSPTNIVNTASRAQLSPAWALAPGSRPYLNSSATERSIAFNPLTGHLLLVSRAPAVGGLQIPVLNGTTGAEVSKLATNGIAGGSAALNSIGVAADGAIYAANVVALNNSSNAAFRIYRWAYESALPSLAYSGEILKGQRWGDTLDVRGSGIDTQILAGSGPGTNKVVVFTTSNGLNFTPTLLNSVGPVNNGDFRTSVAFGPGNTFFGKQINGPLLQMSFNLATQSATVLRSFDSDTLPLSTAGLGVEPNLRLLAGLSTAVTVNGIPNVRLYDLDALSSTGTNQPVDSETFSTANVNTAGISGVVFGDGRLFALDANNGLVAFDLSLLPGTGNLLALDPTTFHEFWINIQRNQGTPGNGTHTVSIYTDGGLTPSVFHVTAGTGSDLSATSSASTNFTTSLATSYLALGCPGSLETGSMDVDFFGYKPGLFPPSTNSPPILAPISDRTIHAGMTLLITNQVFDSDSPPGTLTFSLDSGPPGASVGAANGVFSWTAPASQPAGTNLVVIRVTDSSAVPLSDTRSFRVIVLERPRLGTAAITGGTMQLTWSAIPGQRYRVQFKNNLQEATWQNLAGDILASSPAAVKTDPSASGSQRFYRIIILP